MMKPIKSIAVFCGSSSGNNCAYTIAAKNLGLLLAKRKITLVYGGSKRGIMGAVANACLNAGGHVIGVIPNFLGHKEIAHPKLTELIMVKTMHERKMIMHQKSDAIMALPGGFGTLEELFEMVTWAQLGIHKKPLGVLNIMGYYDDIEKFIKKAINQKLIQAKNNKLIVFDGKVDALMEKLQAYQAPPSDLEILEGQS
jgi:uncharacterized protein (TIGR00730 family)